MNLRKHLLPFAVLAGLGVPAAQGATPSFVCSQAKTWVERTVCQSDALAARDMELASVRARILSTIQGSARAEFEDGQRTWWSSLAACRTSRAPESCLVEHYTRRIAAIRARPDYPGDSPVAPVISSKPAPIASSGEGWTRHLSEYQRALRACNEEASTPIGKVLAAWPGDMPDTVGLRLVDGNSQEWICIAHRDGYKVYRFSHPAADEMLPPAGPVYHLGGEKPPPGCHDAVQVLDAHGKSVGWISEGDC
ncbi:MAG: hypothetical protein GC151_10570 [Betaproteobacteria bacterium]|nr:hypothetical protein [Betaproteobacteria bacterium]